MEMVVSMIIVLNNFTSGSIKATIPNIFNIKSILDNNKIQIISVTQSATKNYEHDQLLVVKHHSPYKAIVNNDQFI